MKNFMIGIAGLGVGGAAWYGMDSPDFDRTIAKSPTAVYSAFAGVSNEGTVRAPRDNELGRDVAMRTTKERGKSLRYEILLDNSPVLTVDVNFAAVGDNQTRVTAELDVDAAEIGSAFDADAGIALALVPDSFIDMQFAAFMEDLAKDVEAGRPLPPLRAAQAAFRRRAQMEAAQSHVSNGRNRREAVRPMTDARPMVDPNAAAEAHRRGRPNPEGDWGN